MTKKHLLIATLAVAGLTNGVSAMEQKPGMFAGWFVRNIPRFKHFMTPMQYNNLYDAYIQDLARAREMELEERNWHMQQQPGLWNQFTNWWYRETPQQAFDRELAEERIRKEEKIKELDKRIDDYFHNWEERYSFDLPKTDVQKTPQKPGGQKLKALHRLDDFFQGNKGQYDWSATTRPTNNLNTKWQTPQEFEQRYEKTKKEKTMEELGRKIDAYFDNWEEKYKF